MALHPTLDDLLELRHQARTIGLASHHLVNSALSGLYASVFRGHGLDFDEIREYREGDDIRNIEWHVTARMGVPHLKVFREERERTVMLCVDRGPHMSFGTRGTFKSVQAARAAALLGWSATNHQDRVGALLFGDPDDPLCHYRPVKGRRALWRMLSGLTQAGTTGKLPNNALVDAVAHMNQGVPTGSLIFIIGSMEGDLEALEQRLGSLRHRHDVVLLPVDDPVDWDLPAMGRLVFVAPDGQRVEIDTDNDSARRRYHQDWQGRREELWGVANRLGLLMIPLRTDEDVHETLTLGLRRRARTRIYRAWTR